MKQRLDHLDRIASEYESAKSSLSEKERRLWAAKQAKDLGYGGISLVCQATGISNVTLHKGIKELNNPSAEQPNRIRKPGGGRKSTTQKLPNIHQIIISLMKPNYGDNQTTPFLWTLHNASLLAKRLSLKGVTISDRNLALLLHQQGYQLRPSLFTGRYPTSKDRDAQCRRIWMMAVKTISEQQPLLFVDVREKQEKLLLKEQKPSSIGLTPCEFGDISHEKGWAFAGIREDNASFILQTLQTWWKDVGKVSYHNAQTLTLVIHGYVKAETNDNTWHLALQMLADDIGLSIRVRHLLSCTFRWNSILHKVTTYGVVNEKMTAINLYTIGIAPSDKALLTSVFWDSRTSAAIRTCPAIQSVKLNIKTDKFHPEWNYTVINKQ